MPKPPNAPSQTGIRLSLRLDLAPDLRIGPGQIVLLEHIDRVGSLRAAASVLGMSYPKALKLVKHLNSVVTNGAVDLAQGGSGGGGASLTSAGRELINTYREIESQSYHTNADRLAAMSTLLQESKDCH